MVSTDRVAEVMDLTRVACEVALELDATLQELAYDAWVAEVRENLVHRLDTIATEA